MKIQYIDYGANADLPARVREAVPDDHMQSVFRATLNSHLRDGKSEMHAYIKAYRALEDSGYARNEAGTWVAKDSPTVSAVHVNRPLGSDEKPKRKDDPGADPPDLEEFEEAHAEEEKDTDEGKAEKVAEPSGGTGAPGEGVIQKYMPPLEVFQDANLALAGGVSAELTSELVEGKGLCEDAVRKVAEWHAVVESGAVVPSDAERNAWGGKHAKKWADRVLKKVGKTLVEKAGSGVLLAFWPEPELAARLAVAGGEKPEDLHVTLAYFGKLADVDMNSVAMMENAVAHFATTHAPVKAELGGLGRFPATPSSDGNDVAYLGVHSPDIQKFRQELVTACESVGLSPKSNFGYNPHMTLKLVPPHAPHFLKTPEAADVTFGEVVLTIGGAAKKYKLEGVEKYSEDQARDGHGRFGEGSGGGLEFKPSARMERALASQVRTGVKEQKIADEQERIISKGIGVPRTGDNSAFDNRNAKVGVEIKTMLSSRNGKITMSKTALARKVAEAKKDKLKTFTVVADKRSGKTSYYVAKGLGSFRVSSMTPATLLQIKEMVHA